ncbi:MAG: sugar phosphate isomerase/epimerase family protein [bacterium]
MKSSICHYSFHRTFAGERWSLERLVREVEALGVDGVDFHARFLPGPEEAPEAIKRALGNSRLQLSGLSFSNDFNADDPKAFRQQVDSVKAWIVAAAKSGAPVSRIFGGHIKDRRDPKALKGGMQRVLDALGEVVPVAEENGLVLAIENHGGLPCTGEEQVEVIEEIGSKCLRATIDVGNYLQGGQEAEEGTRLAAKYCAYVHFKDFKKVPDASQPQGYRLEATTVGRGDVNHRACLRELRRAGYDGFIALEYEGPEDERVGVPESVKFMKDAMAGF